VNNAKAKQNAVPCSKDGCNNKRSVENEYCKLHQLQVFIDETKAAGKKLCYNHNRGCRTQLDESYGYSKCQPCLGDERKKDNEKRNKLKSDNEKVVAPELRTEKGCTNCCKILPMEQFKGILPPHTETLNCISCRENNTKQDLKRDREHRNEIARKNDSKPEKNKKIRAEEVLVDIPIQEVKESIQDVKEQIQEVKEPIQDVNTTVVIQKPKFQKKTPEQLKEDRRIRKQKQRETLKAKLGVEEYNKLRAKEIATNRDTKKK
jgi:hypothetical protein